MRASSSLVGSPPRDPCTPCVSTRFWLACVDPNATVHLARARVCTRCHRRAPSKQSDQQSRMSSASCRRGPAVAVVCTAAPAPKRGGLPAGSPAHAIEGISAGPVHRQQAPSIRLQHVWACPAHRVRDSRAGAIPLTQRIRDGNPVAKRDGLAGRLRGRHSASRARRQVVPTFSAGRHLPDAFARR